MSAHYLAFTKHIHDGLLVYSIKSGFNQINDR